MEVDDNVNDKNKELKVILIDSNLMDCNYYYSKIELGFNSEFS